MAVWGSPNRRFDQSCTADGLRRCGAHYLGGRLDVKDLHAGAPAWKRHCNHHRPAVCLSGGVVDRGNKGLADISLFAGVGLLGGAMFRDFAIVATAFGAQPATLREAGAVGAFSVVFGVVLSFCTGASVAVGFGYTDAVSVATIGAGAATYIVGPVTGTALGASSDVIALSVAAGLVKSILVMVGTPLVARFIGLTTPHAAMIYGGLMGTTSGVAAGLAATDARLVPYGAMTATFYTGVGCLLAPSILYLMVRSLL